MHLCPAGVPEEKGRSAMLVVAYKNYSISVHATLNSALTLFRPDIEIRSTAGEFVLKMSLKRNFSAESAAEAYGVQRGKDWIDRLWAGNQAD